MSMLKAANVPVEILNGSKDPVLVHHVAVVQFLRQRRSNTPTGSGEAGVEGTNRWVAGERDGGGVGGGPNENRRRHGDGGAAVRNGGYTARVRISMALVATSTFRDQLQGCKKKEAPPGPARAQR